MKVLITEFDLFQRIGGGQTFYRRIIERNSHIDFYYLTISENPETKRPANARPIPYKEKYFDVNFKKFYDVTPPRWVYRAFLIASNIAASVAGQRFDIIDSPDYEQVATLLRPALRHHNVDFERIVLSMHGRISTTIRLNWPQEGKINYALVLHEEMQYSTVDIRFGCSKTYLDEWREIINLESHYFNPLWFISPPKPTLATYSTEPPSINFIGRTEKRKGPDIFVDLAWWLPRSSFSTANIIGPESYDDNGVGSGFYLYQMANNRLKDIRIMPAMSQTELASLFASKSITFLPSRYDTFNLLALESLLSGCPTAIGNGAGACRFLKETFDRVPFITINIKNIYDCIPSICSLLYNYDEYREKLVNTLLSYSPEVSGLDLEQIYSSTPRFDSAVRNELDYWYNCLIQNYNKYPLQLKNITINFVKSTTSIKLRNQLRAYRKVLNLTSIKNTIKEKILASAAGSDLKILDQLLKSRTLTNRYQTLFILPEETDKDIINKLNNYWKLGNNFRVDRVRIWREIARLERIRSNELVAATYQLRAMRLLGDDRFDDLAWVVPTLKANGFSREAIVAEAMYGKFPSQDECCSAILEQALLSNKINQQWEYELLDDRRSLPNYRVSVIVSLYNACAKLPLFLKALQNQTMIQAGAAEVILIDSGSPADEYSVFQKLMMSLDIPIVYARSTKRETIQSAWNRGIALSRSPYLTFLGVDEALLPDALEVLAAELDAEPTLDWVIGNSLVTNVDKHGSWINDIMTYDRTGYFQDLVYLETCYLSWVGALYRRSIHERFGFYDASFTAAGDTEFKNRVLPFINTKFIPRTLGVFWNYQDERVTNHPRAEIEDLRAWYLHRTVAGVKYAFANRHPSEAEKLLYSALRYRKSYAYHHWSTDVEYAYNLAMFLQEKLPSSQVLKYLDGIKQLLDAYRSLDWVPNLSKWTPLDALWRTNRLATKLERHHRAISDKANQVPYKIFNDNRHEQHSFIWFTEV